MDIPLSNQFGTSYYWVATTARETSHFDRIYGAGVIVLLVAMAILLLVFCHLQWKYFSILNSQQTLFIQEGVLRATQYLADIVTLQNAFYHEFHHRIRLKIAQEKTIGEFLTESKAILICYICERNNNSMLCFFQQSICQRVCFTALLKHGH